MLLGQDVTQFRSLLKAALADESIAETVHLETTDPEKTKSDVAMVTTRATKRKEEEEHCETESTQERARARTIFYFDDNVFVVPTQNQPQEGPAEQQTPWNRFHHTNFALFSWQT